MLPGAIVQPDGTTRFRVWAPAVEQIALRILLSPAAAEFPAVPPCPARLVPLDDVGAGYHEITVQGADPGTRYVYRLNDRVDRPDPASRFQPEGVHGPSQVVRSNFEWTDGEWRGVARQDLIIYEVHVGTFTSGGTFHDMIPRLDKLVDLGVTAIELMPVAQFPGGRNWGYDGVHPYAPQNSYGGPEGLKALIDACHARRLAVILDVVYNHLGPEGNYLAEFGPYLSDRHRTAWGAAINFDGPESDAVCDFFIGNALYWIDEFHVDGFRLDATHAIYDQTAQPFLRRLTEAVHTRAEQLGRHVHLFAENNANDPRIVTDARQGGLGLDGQVLDDFQRSLHALLTRERAGYYCDFGSLPDFSKAATEGFVLTGQHSKYRRRRWGAPGADVPGDRFIAYAQNHDTVGNRPGGERLGHLVGFEELKLAAAATILSRSIPMLFMGEEYDEPAGFHYFISHLDAGLVEAVRAGHVRQFVAHGWHDVDCDPQSPETFEQSRLTLFDANTGHHAVLWRCYQELIRLRKAFPVIRMQSQAKDASQACNDRGLIVRTYESKTETVCILLNFAVGQQNYSLPSHVNRRWSLAFNSASIRWSGPRVDDLLASEAVVLSPKSCVMCVGK
jgi:maltooligosyltrehalose trehalohydrolase